MFKLSATAPHSDTTFPLFQRSPVSAALQNNAWKYVACQVIKDVLEHLRDLISSARCKQAAGRGDERESRWIGGRVIWS